MNSWYKHTILHVKKIFIYQFRPKISQDNEVNRIQDNSENSENRENSENSENILSKNEY